MRCLHRGPIRQKVRNWGTVQRCRREAADGSRPDSGRHIGTDLEHLRTIERQILAQTFSYLLYFENIKFEEECVPPKEDMISSRSKEYEEGCPQLICFCVLRSENSVGRHNSVTDLFSSTLTCTIPPRSQRIITTPQVREVLLCSRANCSILNGSDLNLCSFLNPPIGFEDSEASFRKFQPFVYPGNLTECSPSTSKLFAQCSDFWKKLVHFVGEDEAYRLKPLLRNRVLADNTPT